MQRVPIALSSLQPAPYQVKAELSGFGVNTREIVLTIGANATLDFKLGVAALEESITVSAHDAAHRGDSGRRPRPPSSSRQIQALPVLERNFLALAQMMPGAAPNYISKFSRVKFGGPADQRNGYTTIVDGGDLDDAIWGDPTVNISQDAVQEFKVFRNQFDAQYGAALAAVVTVVTRSGTNDLHGTGYFFGRDDALNARNAFQQYEAGLRAAAHRRLARRPDLSEPHTLLRRLRVQPRRASRRSSRCRPATRSPPARTASSRPASREHMAGHQVESPLHRQQLGLPPLCLRRPVGDAHRQPVSSDSAPTSTTRARCTA